MRMAYGLPQLYIGGKEVTNFSNVKVNEKGSPGSHCDFCIAAIFSLVDVIYNFGWIGMVFS